MSRRNFTLLIIILIVIVVAVFGYLYAIKPISPTGTDGEEGGTNFLSRFNPFGKSTPAPSPAPTPSPTPGEVPGGEVAMSKLKKISSMPVAGFAVFQKERYREVNPSPALPLSGEGENVNPPAKGGSGGLKPTPPPTEFAPALRYVARATGNIYQTFADKIDERRFSATVIPKVYEAYFGNKGTAVIMRYLKADEKTIQTFVGTLPKEVLGADTTGDNVVAGSFLPDNVTDVSVSADTSKLFYLFNMVAGGESVVGTTLDLPSGKKSQIFDNSFTEWLSSWPNSRMITLTTKPTASVLGYMYALDPGTKSFSRVFGGINGLTTLASPNGKLILYSDSNLSLNIYYPDTKSSASVGLRTLPEKCVWGSASDMIYCAVPAVVPGAEYPDAWYQGEVAFTDQIWAIDPVEGTDRIILDPNVEATEESIDGIKLDLDEGENYLFFVNKQDSYLWEFDLR